MVCLISTIILLVISGNHFDLISAYELRQDSNNIQIQSRKHTNVSSSGDSEPTVINPKPSDVSQNVSSSGTQTPDENKNSTSENPNPNDVDESVSSSGDPKPNDVSQNVSTSGTQMANESESQTKDNGRYFSGYIQNKFNHPLFN